MFNYLTIEFPLAQVPPQRVYSFTLTQERYAHEVAVVKFRDWDIQYSTLRPSEPVRCIIRGKDSAREFVGYIHDVRPEISPGKKFVTVTLIGASYKLKQARQRVFENTTASDVVKFIANQNGFSPYVEDHPRVYDQVTQAGHTDLQLMTRLARQCGYSLRIENTSIYFQSLVSDYNRYKESAKTFTMREANSPGGSTLYSFDLTVGESVQYLDAYKSAAQVGGVDPNSSTPSIVTNGQRPETLRETSRTELFDSFATEVVAPGYNQAVYEASAADQRNRFPYRAMVKIIGTPTINPDKPVYLDGIGKDYSGYWIVLSAQHHIIETSPNILTYITYLEVGADSLGQAVVYNDQTLLPSEISYRALVPNVRNVAESTESTLIKGTQEYANDGFSVSDNRPQPDYVTSVRPYVWVAKRGLDSPSNVDARNRTEAVIKRLEGSNVL
jgi:phage protein D